MLIRSLLSFGLVFALCNTGFSQDIIIDLFTSGTLPNGYNFNLSQTGVGSNSDNPGAVHAASSVLNPIGGVNQGQRIVRAHVTSGDTTLTVDNNVGIADQLNVALGAGSQGHFHLYYGYSNFNPNNAPNDQAGNYADLGRDLTVGGNNVLQISVLDPDHSGAIEIMIMSHRGNIGGTEALAFVSKPYTFGPGVQVLTFNYSEFVGVDFTQVDQIIVQPQGDLQSAADLGLDTFISTIAVPEPATYALMAGVGLAATAGYYRRRHNIKKASEQMLA